MTPSPHEGDTHDWGDYINNSSRGTRNAGGGNVDLRGSRTLSPCVTLSLIRPLKMPTSDFASSAVYTPIPGNAVARSISRFTAATYRDLNEIVFMPV